MPRATNASCQNSSMYGSNAFTPGTDGWMSQSITAAACSFITGFSL